MGETQGLCCGVREHCGQSERHGQGVKMEARREGPSGNPKGHPLSIGQRLAVLGQLPAICLKRGKPARKGEDWESGMPREGSSRQRVKAKQEAWEKGGGTHGGLDLTARGGQG